MTTREKIRLVVVEIPVALILLCVTIFFGDVIGDFQADRSRKNYLHPDERRKRKKVRLIVLTVFISLVILSIGVMLVYPVFL